ncbi:MFS transporter [Cupriavidus sp. TMH.W2]|uniref:MFS transporter n=1 Tax=Cupriavidus sp. TMH.W2 TaxID=3434465 RepID=UPI003D76E817
MRSETSIHDAQPGSDGTQPDGGSVAQGIASAILSLLIGYAVLITGNGLLGTLISLRMVHSGVPPVVLGIVQSSYYVGFMLGAILCGSLIARVGHHRAFVVFAAVATCSALSYALITAPFFWICLRFTTGFCLVGVFTVMESWLHASAGNATRARVFSAYLITTYLGVGTGQFLINLADPSGFQLFTLVGGLFAASLIPVTLASSHGATHSAHGGDGRCEAGRHGLRTVLRSAPLGLWGALAAGLLNSAFYSMHPVFMRSVGYSVASVSHFMGIALVAALLPQWPIARLSDRFDRRIVLLAVSLLSALCSLMLLLFRASGPLAILSYVYVSLIFTIYGIVISHVNDFIPPLQRVAVSAGLLLIFSVGGIAGPTLASLAMAMTGPAGPYLFTMIVTSTLALLTLRSFAVQRMPHHDR